MLAIQTSFVDRTAKHPAKIVARSGISKVSIPFDATLSLSANHAAAVRKLCYALGRSADHLGAVFGEDMYWIPAATQFQVSELQLPPAQEPVEAQIEVPPITLAAEPESAPVEAPTGLAEPAPEPIKPTRQRRAA